MKNLPRCARICKGIGAEIGQSEQLMLLFHFYWSRERLNFAPDQKVIISVIGRNVMSTADEIDASPGSRHSLKVDDWLWRPLYAKLWWAAIPIYWSGMALSSRSPTLDAFYSSALAGFMSVFFFPPLVAVILCFGFFRAWLDTHSSSADGQLMEVEEYLSSDRLGPSGMPWEFDPLDQRSGAHWNGSPINPINPLGINRAS